MNATQAADDFAVSYGRARGLIAGLKESEMMTHAAMLAHPSMQELLKIDKALGECVRVLDAVNGGAVIGRLVQAQQTVSAYAEAIRWDIDRLLENTLPDPSTTDCDECCYPIPDSCTSNMNGFHSSSCSLTDDDSEN